MNNEQKALLKQLLNEVLAKYNKQRIEYNPQNHNIVVNNEYFAIPKNNPRSTMATRTTHTR